MAAFRFACRTGGAALALLLAQPALAQYIGAAPPPLPDAPIGAEAAGDALARNVRILAQTPRNYAALVGAGRAALATGDAQTALGFFGRAADLSPAAPVPRAGLGAALTALGEADRALPEFARAQQLGGPVASFAVDRGLARDLLGQQALAQSDYRLALGGPDGDEARRRLALSLAISGDRAGALTALAPLLRHSDVATNRVHAFVLALGGDADGADRALDRSVPGMSIPLDPFFRRLPALSPAQKAAAVHLGIIPSRGSGTAVASAPVPPPGPITAQSQLITPAPRILAPVAPMAGDVTTTQPVTGDRLAGIEALLRKPSQTPSWSAPPPPQPHYETPLRSPSAAAPPSVPAPRRYWVQLANGVDDAALNQQFVRIAARQPDMFAGIKPYVSKVGDRTRLLVGPFKSSQDSETFVENLADARIEGFPWTSPTGQVVRKLVNP